MFFFEKKNQKTFFLQDSGEFSRPETKEKVSLLLSFQRKKAFLP
jgi:hypothetical protein